MEIVAREWWALETGEFGAPAVLEHDILPHIRTSLDLYVACRYGMGLDYRIHRCEV